MDLTPQGLQKQLAMKYTVSDVQIGDKLLHTPSQSTFIVVEKMMSGENAHLILNDGYDVFEKKISDDPFLSELDCQWEHIAQL
jgi:hypothetical protein